MTLYELSPYAVLGALTLFFLVLGCFLDGISVVLLTTSIFMPLVEQAGIDPFWFGIFVVIVVEMSQITPPVGFNLIVIQGLTGLDILRVVVAALPFFLLLLVALVLIVVFPSLVTLLPNKMRGSTNQRNNNSATAPASGWSVALLVSRTRPL